MKITETGLADILYILNL